MFCNLFFTFFQAISGDNDLCVWQINFVVAKVLVTNALMISTLLTLRACFLLLWSSALCHEDNLVICLPGLCHRFCLSWILSFGRLFVKKWTQHYYRYANEWPEDIPSFSSLFLHTVVKASWAKEKGIWLILNCWVPLIHKAVHEILCEYLRTSSIKWEEYRKYVKTGYLFLLFGSF